MTIDHARFADIMYPSDGDISFKMHLVLALYLSLTENGIEKLDGEQRSTPTPTVKGNWF